MVPFGFKRTGKSDQEPSGHETDEDFLSLWAVRLFCPLVSGHP